MTADSASISTGTLNSTPLRATIEVDPPESAACVVVGETDTAAEVTRSCTGESCHSEITIVEDESCRQTYVSGKRTETCVCGTIGEFDCAFDVDEVSDGALVIELVVPDREVLGEIVTTLQETGAVVRLSRLSHLEGDTDATIEIDATSVTEKQREAVELAVELGYYDRPREATLSDLADELGISRSAVSQRLSAVELTLIRSLVNRE